MERASKQNYPEHPVIQPETLSLPTHSREGPKLNPPHRNHFAHNHFAYPCPHRTHFACEAASG